MKNRAEITEAVLGQVYSALPPPTAEPVDYYALRGKVRTGHQTLRNALYVLIAQRRAEGLKGGLRGRKVFRRTSDAECVRG